MDASLSHATGINKPLRFFKRFVAVGAIKLDRNQIKRLVLACRFDLTAIDFGNYRSPRSISGLEGADGEPFVVRNAVSIGWHGAIYGRKGENGMIDEQLPCTGAFGAGEKLSTKTPHPPVGIGISKISGPSHQNFPYFF